MKRINYLNIIAMNIIIVIITSCNHFIYNLLNSNFILTLTISVVASIFSYQALTEILYKLVEKSDFLFRKYWGKMYLRGIWYYEYTIQGGNNQKYYGVWEIEQDLSNIKIIGYGYNENLTEIRTRLSSVTDLIQNGNFYDIVHKKNEMSNPNTEFYAKSSISFLGNSKKYPTKFHSVTYIYGGNHTGETHQDTFYKVENAKSEDEAIQIIKNGGTKMIPEFGDDKRVVILVMGRTASGKTTTAKKLAKVLDYEYIPCAYYKRLVKSEYSKSDSLSENLRDAGLKLAVNAAIETIKRKSIVLDSSFGIKERRKYVIKNLAKYADSIFLVYCKSTNIDETRNRIESRKGREEEDIQFHASDYKIFEHINQTFEEPDVEELNIVSGCKYIFYIDTFNKEISSLNNNDNLVKSIYRLLKENVL